MHEIVREARGAAPEQARDPVRIPAAVMDPLAAEARQTVDRIDLRGRRADRVADRLREFRGDDFVGIEGQDPVGVERIERAVLLRAEARPVALDDHACAVRLRDRDGIVGAAAVDDDDVVGERQRGQALCEPRGRVEGDECDAEGGFSHEIVGKGGENGERQYTRGPAAARIGHDRAGRGGAAIMLSPFRHPPDRATSRAATPGRRFAAQEGLPWKPRTLFANRWTARAPRP
ncbi:hypothetical protein BCO18430_05271 [Burkholderia contaminans]|nr:hypothetical protein BCO18430_05271 [Burkholderia contaminans]